MPRAAKNKAGSRQESAAESPAADLSYNEARTALELALAELQSSDLEVEAMAGLYQRAQAYANRCQAVLDSIEQQVLLWDTSDPDAQPKPFQP